MAKKEVCPKCSGQKYSKATDGSEKRYCSSCHHVWVLSMDVAMSKPEFQLKRVQQENIKLADEISRLRRKVKQYEDAVGPEASPDEEGLFE